MIAICLCCGAILRSTSTDRVTCKCPNVAFAMGDQIGSKRGIKVAPALTDAEARRLSNMILMRDASKRHCPTCQKDMPTDDDRVSIQYGHEGFSGKLHVTYCTECGFIFKDRTWAE